MFTVCDWSHCKHHAVHPLDLKAFLHKHIFDHIFLIVEKNVHESAQGKKTVPFTGTGHLAATVSVVPLCYDLVYH